MSFFCMMSINYCMNLLDEIDSIVAKEYGITFNDYRLVNISGKVLYIEGHTGINLLGNKEMSFKVKKKILTIRGENLTVKYFDKSTAMILGKIVQVEVI